ncbi:MAG TPA: restriction endonuclease [Pedobacter sp.]|uniref:restriction endonuclease n=1 Tax=Pedobacter sp. TaxID=1411316 RepID=UPI002CA10B89|nr:restriction endonuclease [Pedobacter sp.]HMI04879.1 restriction endonuclease [Pedobacter sp.]
MTKKKNTGVDFEAAVKEIFEMYYKKYPTATFERNVMMDTKYGKREVDVLITVPISDYNFQIVVEARDFNSKLSIDKIDGFHSKLGDLKVDKGIIVSKLGFSSKAINKAKALDIGLYSLREQKAFPDLDSIFFLIEEVSPIAFEAAFTMDRAVMMTKPDSFIIRDEVVINGQNFEDNLNIGWADNTINFDLNKDQQDVTIPSIQPPYVLKYYVDDRRGITNTMPLKDLKITVHLGTKYFIADINALNKHKILENIHRGQLHFFVNEQSIKDAIDNLNPVTPSFASTFLGIKARIKVKGKAELRIEGLNIRPGKK